MKHKYNYQMNVGKENNYNQRLNDYDVAKQAEQSFAEFVPSIKQEGFKLIDVSGDKEYQKQDVDFLGVYRNGHTEKIEIKHDTTCFDGRKTGNLCFEIKQRGVSQNDYEYQLDGWFLTSTADTLIFMHDIEGEDDYLCTEFDFKELRQLYKKKPNLFKEVTAYHGCVNILISYETLINELGDFDCWRYEHVKRVD